MQISKINAGDVVECDIKGTVFYAKVMEKTDGGLSVQPITKNVGYFSATSRQVIGHWKKAK